MNNLEVDTNLLIKEFIELIRNKYNFINLDNNINNLVDLKIVYVSEFKNFDKRTYGYFDKKSNIIYIKKDKFNKHVFFHELLHALTYKYRKGYFYCGISMNKLGESLNEGITEYIIDDLLDTNTKFIYSFNKKIIELLEPIIGKDLLIDYYFNSDLNSLINDLIKYSNKEKTCNFIKYCDYVNNNINKPISKLKVEFIIDYIKLLYKNKFNKNIDLEVSKILIK